ncbi:hypothetical protein EIN_212960 [Entamoeba invadens IP1]|uniref:VWFA domain-containing protein n=1 Tax=Entamoeba invadens IP1 TaxID=370355 RepID=A0A0A1TX77_ENTIV|nr:hypothetical protein EIN_212960 [Entamoeba invadens IP1]ELP84076.1 hypothetical protein EIN_212960 [Entamoeba invadens IP1]|eukprot:XP_004183422.1 hypothetical protein EIN_212960 [Entamoeba invadens IP1]
MTQQLDLVFLVDSTGSMGQYLESAKRNIRHIVETIQTSENIDLRFSLVEYKDHKPIEPSFAVKEYGWKTTSDDIYNDIAQLSAYGGGMDGPESVTCAFSTAVEYDFRQYAAKIIIWICDAPPHGFNIQYDGFPDGCPCGIDFQKVVLKAVQKDIQVYSIACEPIRSIYRHFRDLMRAVAQITGGQFVPLISADSLGDVIIGGSLEGVGMKDAMNLITLRMEAVDGFDKMTKDEKEKLTRKEIAEYFANGKNKIKQVEVKSVFKGEMPEIPKIYFLAQTFKELVDVLKTREPSVYHFVDGVKLDEYVPTPQSFWDKSGVAAYHRKVRGEEVESVKIELCNEDEYRIYRGFGKEREGDDQVQNKKVENFKEGETVRVQEAPVGPEQQEKLISRLMRKLKN